MRATLRAGVIGAGVFGGYHAEKWATMEGARLTAIFDTHPERSRDLAARFGASAYFDMPAFMAAVDLVSIASPASSHAARALQALRANKSVYIEKPLAVNLAEADSIVDEASRRGLIVACGFLERVAFAALGLGDRAERPLRVEAVRLGGVSPRNQDVSVVLDLMIHDIDLVLALAPGSPLTVEAEGTAGPLGRLDDVTAEITFDSGFTARLRASRMAETPERSMRIVYASGEVAADLLAGRLVGALAGTSAPADRLRASLEAFLAAARGEGAPLADGVDGVRALDLALAVEHAAAS